MDAEGHWGNGLSPTTFYWCIYGYFGQFIREGRKGKRTPLVCLACNNFFDDGIKWKNGSDGSQKHGPREEKESCGCTGRFISRNGLREGMRIETFLGRPRRVRPQRESQKNNKQQVNTIINYILFYGTKLGLWVMGSFGLWKGEKGKA